MDGEAAFYSYGVINDQANSDGSFVFPVTASSLARAAGQTLPVIVETGDFTSELIVTNFSNVPKTVTFRFRAEAVQTPDKTATVEWDLQPGQPGACSRRCGGNAPEGDTGGLAPPDRPLRGPCSPRRQAAT